MTDQWGPEHQTLHTRRPIQYWKIVPWVIIGLAVLGITHGGVYSGQKHHQLVSVIFGFAILALLGYAGLPAGVQAWLLKPIKRVLERPRRADPQPPVSDPLRTLRNAAWDAGGGVHLGSDAGGRLRFSRAQRAVLVLGPPRSGKTSAVIIPTLISHTGPVVATSTKPDVYRATRLPRAVNGNLWIFDPTGSTDQTTAGVRELSWSPVTSAVSWDGGLLIARALTTNVGAGTTERSHWANRAQALLAPMLHAAAIHTLPMRTVVEWVAGHQLDDAGVLLEDGRCSQLAFSTLVGIHNTEQRERSSIFSAAADALQAYTSEHALDAADHPNFDPEAFVRSQDTIYIHAPAEHQAAVAPIVCGLLTEIRRATYQAHANNQLIGRVLFCLDEAANIAPLEELPQIASEGGGQGLLLLAALQDLSQARARWGAHADGFLTLFGTKLILSGVADTRTLEAVSVMLGEYDRQVISHNHPDIGVADVLFSGRHPLPKPSTSYSTQRTRVLSPGEIANLPVGRGLHLAGVRWELITLTPAHAVEPWRALTTLSAS